MSNQSELIEEILTEEVKNHIGYIMQMMEVDKASPESRQNVKKTIWSLKEKLKAKLIQVKQNEKSNQD
jgi:hypothetical protein